MMKLTMKTMALAFAATLALTAVSCSDEDFGPSIFDTTEYPLDRTSYTFPLDTFCKVNFLEPYNLKYMYQMEDVGTDMNYNLIPCSYDQSVTLAVLCKYLWYDVYKDIVGEQFLKTFSPRIIHVIGSPAYNPTQGTMVLGTAEGGLKITLYNAEHLSPSDIDYMNEYFFKTMHHEFSHILNQRYNRPTEFDLLSNGKYNTVSWNDTPDSVALGQGFISPYASSQAREDWVEIIANYIVKDTITWNKALETAAFSWELATDVRAAEWDKFNAQVLAGRANRDSVGYYVRTSSTSGGEDATYAIQRKLIVRDSLGYAIPGANGEIQFLKTSGVDGKGLIKQKLEMAREWLKTHFNYDLEAVRMAVQRRQWLTDKNGNFVFDDNGNFINNLVFVRADGTTVLDDLRQEVDKYKALQP
jgi:substrate import-associated zinc metallohydrolase lipoprotein